MLRVVLLTLAAAVVGSLASPLDEARLLRRSATLYTSCTVPNTVALTFDDGPYIYNKDIVDQLDAAGIKATFWFNGNNYRCIYDADSIARVKYVYDHGHMVGSHTWAHKDLTTLTSDQIHNEMWLVEQAIQRITGALVAFMRPPYGAYNQQVLDVSGIRDQGVVIWDFDSQDSVGATPDQSKALYDGVISQHPSTILTLNHETYETTAHEVLPYAIQKLKAAGYKFATVAECLGLAPYRSIQAPATPANWTCVQT